MLTSYSDILAQVRAHKMQDGEIVRDSRGRAVCDPVATIENIEAYKSLILDSVRNMSPIQRARLIKALMCLDHTGKMSGLASLSSSCLCNAQCCKNMQVKGAICENCFSSSQLKMYPAQNIKLYLASVILQNIEFAVEDMPVLFDYDLVRIEAFGDIANTLQAKNYIRFCYANPHSKIGWWTKNPAILKDAVTELGKPKNLVLVLSSMFKDRASVELFDRYGDIFDKLFTVYSTEDSCELLTGSASNCAAYSCASCQNCYRKDTTAFISEIVK